MLPAHRGCLRQGRHTRCGTRAAVQSPAAAIHRHRPKTQRVTEGGRPRAAHPSSPAQGSAAAFGAAPGSQHSWSQWGCGEAQWISSLISPGVPFASLYFTRNILTLPNATIPPLQLCADCQQERAKKHKLPSTDSLFSIFPVWLS